MRLLCVLLLALLNACASRPPTPLPTATEQPVEPVVSAANGVLRGQLLLPPGASLPAAARLQLLLADRFSDDPAQLPLAASERPLEGNPPFAFELAFDRAGVRDISVYRLDVAVFDASGRLAFVSDGEHPVNLGVEAEPTRIELMTVAADAGGQQTFDCGELIAELQLAGPDLHLQLPGARHHLRRAHAAAGVRYVGALAEFWSRDDEARIQLGAQAYHCQRLR